MLVGKLNSPRLPLLTVDITLPTGWDGTPTATPIDGAALQAVLEATATINTHLNDTGHYIIELDKDTNYSDDDGGGPPTGGSFVIDNSAYTGTNWIIIRSSGFASLTPGTRVTTDVTNMATITQTENKTSFRVNFGGHHVRVIGIEFTVAVATVLHLAIGTDSGFQTPFFLSELAHHVIIDRCYFHSTSETLIARVGITVNCNYFACIESRGENYKDGSDNQAILFAACQGPIHVENNYLSASSENIMFGGNDLLRNERQHVDITGSPTGGTFTLSFDGEGPSDPIAWNADEEAVQTGLESLSNIDPGDVACTKGPLPTFTVRVDFTGKYGIQEVVEMTTDGALLTGGASPDSTVTTFRTGGGPPIIPSDIRIWRNHFFKPDKWNKWHPDFNELPDGGFDGGWNIKNSFELKSAKRIHFWGNVFDNSWVDGHLNMLTMTIRNQDGKDNFTTVRDVTFENNLFKKGPHWMNLLSDDDMQVSSNFRRMKIRNNLIHTMGGAPNVNEVQWVQITGTPTGGTFTLSFDGQGPTNAIAFDATASEVQTRLEIDLSNITSGDVVCTNGPLPGNVVKVEFAGTYATVDVTLMTTDGALLTGGASPDSEIILAVLANVADPEVYGTAGEFIDVVKGTGKQPMIDLIVDHNTFVFQEGTLGNKSFGCNADGVLVDSWIITNNIWDDGNFAQFLSRVAAGHIINEVVSGNGIFFNPAALSYSSRTNDGTFATNFPGNTKANTIALVKFTDNANQDYTLQSDSPFKNAANDGKDCGVDFVELNAAIAGVV